MVRLLLCHIIVVINEHKRKEKTEQNKVTETTLNFNPLKQINQNENWSDILSEMDSHILAELLVSKLFNFTQKSSYHIKGNNNKNITLISLITNEIITSIKISNKLGLNFVINY